MRLDRFLHQTGWAKSRSEAKELILSSFVSLNGQVVDKPAHEVDPAVPPTVTVDRTGGRYVSRGGFKLAHALEVFSVSAAGKTCLDIGASSGGFTDCLLQHGAAMVYAVDAGSGQLAEALRGDSRVRVYENYNARYMQPDDFPSAPSLVVMDVSFISQTYLLPRIAAVAAPSAAIVTLIKPQFELGRAHLSKKGIVRDEAARRSAVEKVKAAAALCGFSDIRVIDSPLTGGDGNREYLMYCHNQKQPQREEQP
ncbi:MAG: TlyA family RNA methyltransferase [Eubacteriales bacterium]